MPRTKTTERESIPFQTRQDLFMACRGRCPHCGQHLTLRSSECTVEHVIPINKGGNNDTRNLTILCSTCNRDKSDDIIPPDMYYEHMPKERRDELQRMFEEYLTTYDYLAYDSLFQTDWFDMRVMVPVFTKNRTKVNLAPANVQIRKMRPWSVLEWLFPYTAHLHTNDKALIATQEHQLATPYYMAWHQGKPIFLFSPYISKTEAQTAIREKGTSRNVLFMDIFVHQDMPLIQGRIDFVLSILFELEHRIQQALCDHSPNTVIEYVIRTPGSDKAANAVLDRMRQLTPNRIAFVGESEDGSEIHCLDALLFQGRRSDITKLQDELGVEIGPDKIPLVSVEKLDAVQRPLDETLRQSKEISCWTPPKPLTKKEKKSRHKKPKRHK